MSRFKEILKETLIEQQLDESKLATVVQGAIVVKNKIDSNLVPQKEKDS